MPRASRYLLKGHTYHLTHRCHGKEFFLKGRDERSLYRKWLREGVCRFGVPVYAYCITRNHVHVVAHAADREAISNMMHLASGSVAKRYNLQHERCGSLWEHPYQCTVVQDGQHLLNCLRYVDLNMVRAGVVGHPRDWAWCGYDELVGERKRYRILNLEHLVDHAGFADVPALQTWYRCSIEERLAADHQLREPHWTEALAVGSKDFVSDMTGVYRDRSEFSSERGSDGSWYVRERSSSYSPEIDP